MAEKQKVVFKKTGEKNDIIKIHFSEPLDDHIQHTYLATAISKCFKNKFYKIILDMANINQPSSKFIATVIEATAKVRTKEGDVKLINISDQARQVVSSFNSYAYLSVQKESDE